MSADAAKLEQEGETIRKVFREWDKDGNGTISRQELSQVMRALCGHLTQDDVEILMTEADANGNGVIDLDEFVAWLTKPTSASQGKAIINYSKVLRPLFDIYKSPDSEEIDKESFMEVHCIMQGALSLNPASEDEARVDPLALNKAHEDAFTEADKTKNGVLTFREFIEWIRAHIPEGMSADDLKNFVDGLVTSMQAVKKVVRMAEEGTIGDDEEGAAVLSDFLGKLADQTRTFSASLEMKETGNSWVEPPIGLNVEKLKSFHTKLFPVNARQVKSIVFEVLVLPLMGVMEIDDPTQRVWCGEVLRRIKYKSGKLSIETPCYYKYQRDNFSWQETCRCLGSEKFEDALKGLAPELGLFCTLKTEANFGTKLLWAGIKNALEGGVDMGFLTEEQMEQYVSTVKGEVRENLRSQGHFAHHESAQETEAVVEDFLKTLSLAPRMVMAGLGDMKIMKIRPEWANFVMSQA